ncbi:response regulator [Reinekea forsetii]|nr:response regulator [Reinekea forsetii]
MIYYSNNAVKAGYLFSLMAKLMCVSLFLMVASANASAQSRVELINNFKWLGLYEDTSGEMTALEVAQKSASFEPVEGWLSYGETKSHLWLSVDFTEANSDAENIWLELGNPVTDYINLYQVNRDSSGEINIQLIQETGDARLFESRGISIRNFLLPLENSPNQTYLVEIYGKSPLAVPIEIGELSSLLEAILFEVTFVYLLFGIMIAMTLYNGFLYLGTRISSYGWYTLYLASIFMFLVFSSGTGYKYLWYNSATLQNNLGYLFIGLFLFGAFSFTRNFLNISEILPKFDRFFRWFAYSPLLIVIAVALAPALALKLSTFYMLALTLMVPTLSIVAVIKGSSGSWLFLLSWIFMVVGMLTYNLAIAGALPLNFISLHAGEIGVTLESILLSFALAYRIRMNEQKASEQEAESFRRIEAALDLAARNEAAKDSFLRSSSHQLKTPIHALLSYIQLLKEDLEDSKDDTVTTHVIGADKSATELFYQIDNLLTYSQIVAGDLRPIYQKTNVRNEINRLMRAWSEHLTSTEKRVECAVASEVPQYLDLDWFHIRKIIRIALENAFNTTEAGTVRVKIDVAGNEASPTLRCSIEDQGSGVPEDILAWFVQEDSGDKWTEESSGLFICKNLVRVVHGQITLANKADGGAIFTLEAPVRVLDNQCAQGEVNLAEKSVMVVDDVEVNQRILMGMLKKIGVNSYSVGSGEEALQRLALEPVDLILMDCLMPGLSGQETAQVIRARQDELANTCIIAVSANDSDLDRQSCFDAGMQDFISKPVRKDHLEQKLKEWLV